MEDNLNSCLSQMPAATQSCHRGRIKAEMCCWRAWLISSEGIRPIRAASTAVPACCPVLAAPLQAHTPAPGCPPPQTVHPPSEALLGVVHPSLLVPPRSPAGRGCLSSGTGEGRPGEGRSSPRHGRRPRCRARRCSLSASRCPSVPRPLPAARPPGGAARCGKQLSPRCGSRGGTTEKRHLHPYIRIRTLTSSSAPYTCTPHPASTRTPRTPHPHPPPGRAFWPRPGRGGPGSPELQREGGREGEAARPPRAPRPRARPGGTAGAGAGGGSCSTGRGLSRGWDDKTGGNCI